MDEVEVLRIRVRDLENKLFESHIGTCWGAPNCRCGSWCSCPHRQVMKPLLKCCGDCKKVLRRVWAARSRANQQNKGPSPAPR